MMDRYWFFSFMGFTIALLLGGLLAAGFFLIHGAILGNGQWEELIGMLIVLDVLVFIRFFAYPIRFPEDFISNWDDPFELYNDIPNNVRHAVWKRDKGKCAQCGTDKNISYHRNYRAGWNGENTVETIQILCPECYPGY
jgi:hypothetical protein